MKRFEPLILVGLFLVFISMTIPGIAWGAPGFWHPDELVQDVQKAIERGLGFDEKNFNYPSLPKYVMYAEGKFLYSFGIQKSQFIQAARLISVILGGLIVALVYLLTRWMRGGIMAGVLAALLLLTNRDMAIYSHFAHSDPYLVFFVCATVGCLIRFRISSHRGWLYAAFLGVGLATSSKYNGMGLLIAVLIVFLVSNWRKLSKDPFSFFETLFVGLILSGLGYAIGTPKSLLSMAFYFENVIPAIQRQATYNREAGTSNGLFGQWGVLWGALGVAVSILFLAALIWFCLRVARFYFKKEQGDRLQVDLISILLLCILAMDLPILVSYHYPPRFFLPILPLLCILTGLFVEDLIKVIEGTRFSYVKWICIAGLVIVLAYSFLRVIAVEYLFLNDNRIAAGEYLKILPEGSTLEYTDSPPNLPEGHFSKLYKHPLYVKKFENQPPPERNAPKYNQGEIGVEDRQPDYLLIDSFTSKIFLEEGDCDYLQPECDFFQNLLAGETNYQLIQSFDYTLPRFLPRTEASFVNPVILIYKRAS